MKVSDQFSKDLKNAKVAMITKSGNPNRIFNLPTIGTYTVLDNGCDQALLGKGWCVVKVHDTYIYDHNNEKRQLVDAIATIIEPLGARKRIGAIRVNQAMYDPSLQETLLPPDQMRWNGIQVDCCAITHGGKQKIIGPHFNIDLLWDGKTMFFIHTRSSLCDKGKKLLELTSSQPYNPREYALHDKVYRALGQPQSTVKEAKSKSNQAVIYAHPTVPSGQGELDSQYTITKCRRSYLWNATAHLWKAHQLAEWKKRMCCTKDDSVKKTFLATTQLVPSVQHENEAYPKDYHVSRFPMLSCRRIHEKVYCDVVQHPIKQRQFHSLLLYSEKSKIMAIYPLGKDASSHKTLEFLYEFVRDFGAPTTLVSDFANNLTQSVAWKRFSRLLVINIHGTEPHKHNQNVVERAWQDLKYKAHYMEQRSALPEEYKFALLKHMCDCHNHTALDSLKWRTPLEVLSGETPDISCFRYYFWEPVWYLKGPATFPDRKWLKGRFHGIAWHTGDKMCYEICPDGDTTMKRVVHRSVVIARHPEENAPKEILNHSSDHFFPTPKITSTSQSVGRKRSSAEALTTNHSDTEDDIMEEMEDPKGETAAGPIEKQLRADYLREARENDERLRDLSSPPPTVLDYGNIAKVLRHRKHWKGNVEELHFSIETTDGHVLNKIGLVDLKIDAPTVLSKYILSNQTLKKVKELQTFAKNHIKSIDRVLQLSKSMARRLGIQGQREEPSMVSISCLARIKTRRTKKQSNSPNKRKSNPMGSFKYGIWVPKTVKEALAIDEKNGNSSWRVAICKEIEALQSMNTFKVIVKTAIVKTKANSQYAPLRMIFDIKQDLRHKARLVIGGHVVDSVGYDVYASNMKTISARLLMLIATHNKLDVLTGDIGNAYLYAKSNQKIYCRLGEEFHLYDKKIPIGTLASVEQALYGLPTSANRWHAHLADTLRAIGFFPTRYDQDVWMRDGKHGYEYIGTHTDDLMVVAKDPRKIMDVLQKTYVIKKIQEPDFHLGCNYKKNSDGTWSIGTETYVSEAIKKVESILGTTLGKAGTPMAEDYKPELDESELLQTSDHRKYQQLLGIAQWLITCGRLDLSFAVNSLSRFSSAPRADQLKHCIRIFKYINQFPKKWIKIDPSNHVTGGGLTDPTKGDSVDWTEYYADAKEEVDQKCPPPKGKPMTTQVYFDSNHAHDEVTRRSITGTITYVGNTPVSWMSKRQGAIATSTYSAELCAARQGTEEAINVRYMLRSLGIPLAGKTILAGDNLGSLISATKPGSPCKKKHSSIAYHYVRECNAAGIIDVCKVHTDYNLSDPFTKALGKNKFWGNFGSIFEKEKFSV